MQLTNLSNLRKGNLIFNEPKQYQVKNSKLKYQRVKIETMFGSKKKGPVLIETPFLFSFGVSERLSQETNQLVGYTVPLCLRSKESQPTVEESIFFNAD